MNFVKPAVAWLCAAILAISCTTSKQILYFQDIDTAEIERMMPSKPDLI